MGLLWMRTSAEYRALAYQGYNVAMNLVKMAVADPSHQRKPLAIVLDADETVVDNTKLMGESIANGNGRFDAPGGARRSIKANLVLCQVPLSF